MMELQGLTSTEALDNILTLLSLDMFEDAQLATVKTYVKWLKGETDFNPIELEWALYGIEHKTLDGFKGSE